MNDINNRKCCDNCTHYEWYYDKCKKYNCIMDARSVCDSFEAYERERHDSIYLRRQEQKI